MRITEDNFEGYLRHSWDNWQLESIKTALEISKNCGYKVSPGLKIHNIEAFFIMSRDNIEILKRAPKKAQYKLLSGLNSILYISRYKQLMRISDEIKYNSYLYSSFNPRFLIDTNLKPLFKNKFTKNVDLARVLYNKIEVENTSFLPPIFLGRDRFSEDVRRDSVDARKVTFTALLLMIEQFGFENVSKAIEKFHEDNVEVTIYDLFKVASDWEANQDYPLDWILT